MATQQLSKNSTFCVPRKAIARLLKADVDVGPLCTYLVIAAYTEQTGTHSTAGVTAIHNRLGCRKEIIESFIAKLVAVGVVKDLRQSPGSRPSTRKEVRFHLPDFEEPLMERIWFDRSLTDEVKVKASGHPSTHETIDGSRRARFAISRLYDLTKVCFHLFVELHALNEHFWTGVRPHQPSINTSGVFVRYSFDEDQYVEHSTHRVQIACRPELDLRLPVLETRFGHIELLGALEALRVKGFIYEVVMVHNRPLCANKDAPDESYLPLDAKPIYQLHGRGQARSSEDEAGVSNLTLLAMKGEGGCEPFAHDGSVENAFVLISSPGMQVGVAGIFRLRHRVRNPKAPGLANAWAELMESHSEQLDFITDILQSRYQMDVSSWKQCEGFRARREGAVLRASVASRA